MFFNAFQGFTQTFMVTQFCQIEIFCITTCHLSVLYISMPWVFFCSAWYQFLIRLWRCCLHCVICQSLWTARSWSLTGSFIQIVQFHIPCSVLVYCSVIVFCSIENIQCTYIFYVNRLQIFGEQDRCSWKKDKNKAEIKERKKTTAHMQKYAADVW